jgi:hypothetical protein
VCQVALGEETRQLVPTSSTFPRQTGMLTLQLFCR